MMACGIYVNASCGIICVILSCLMLSIGGNDDNTYYLVTKDKTCLVGTNLGEPLDLVCQHYDRGPPAKPKLCTLSNIQWQRLGVGSILNITDSYKFGVWETLPGWGMSEQEHISLMRIRDFSVRDLGTYQCHITCEDRRGRIQHQYYYVDVCLKENHSQQTTCASHLPPSFCAKSFRDGVCDLDCDTERHLFDGFDCMDELPKCQEMYQDFCAGRFANGICDESCNSEPCFWDGGDCITEQIKFVDDTLVLYLSDWSTSVTNAIDLKELGRSLSKLLRTIVRILPDEVENDLAEYQAARTGNRRSLNKRSSSEVDNIQADDKKSQSRRLTRNTSSVYETNQRLRIKLDNTKCKHKCFKKVSKAAEFIYLSLQKGWDPGIPISAIAVLTRDNSRCQLENNTLLHIDLSGLDRGPKKPNSGFWSLTGWTFDTWMIVAIASGAICVLVVIVTVTVIVYHVMSSAKLRKRHLEQARIMHGEKHHLRGTDV